jgi:hypothetical protein
MACQKSPFKPLGFGFASPESPLEPPFVSSVHCSTGFAHGSSSCGLAGVDPWRISLPWVTNSRIHRILSLPISRPPSISRSLSLIPSQNLDLSLILSLNLPESLSVSHLILSLWVTRAEGRRRRNEEERRKGEEE